MSQQAGSRVIVLTGVTRGLGRALVDRFVEAGHVLAGCGRSADKIAQLQTMYGPPHEFHVVDVASDEEVSRWAERVCAEQGVPDLLINNAAIINPNAVLWDVPAAEFDPVVDVNIKGVANSVRHFVPRMIESGRGVIVNVSSGWGRSTSGEVATYCATKWAIEGLTQAMAQELPSGMAAVPLNPGVIHTELLQSCFGAAAEHYPTAEEWSFTAAPFLLRLGARDNGRPLTVG